jgi:hypothetical protein
VSKKQHDKWLQIIQPTTVNIIIGKKGMGKSALGYFLVDILSKKYDLLPVVAGFPADKHSVLPDNYIIRDLDEALVTEDAVLLIDEGTTMLPAGSRFDELVKSLCALSRQRNQIIFMIFHTSRDIGSKILRGVDTIMIKEPSRRQIDQGSKSNWWYYLLTQARQKIREQPGNRKRYTYVDCEEPDFRGILINSLPRFWSEDLSKAWANVDMLVKRSSGLKSEKDITKLWNSEHQSLLDEIRSVANQRGLTINYLMDIKQWVVNRVNDGSLCCIAGRLVKCPCDSPEEFHCPLFMETR